MSSGMYSALSGALVRMHRLDTISDNLGNAKTAGFKAGMDVFQAVLDEARARSAGKGMNFSRLRVGYTDFGQGTIVKTSVPLHVALDGEGFFRVRDAEGDILYTREGNMRLDAEGKLLTGPGLEVLDEKDRPIVLPGSDVSIDERGNISASNGFVQRLPVWVFDDPMMLTRRAGGQFAAGEMEPRPAEKTRVLQEHQEESNVSMMQEMNNMMVSLRAFEACQGALKTYHELAGKANEIGSLG